MSYERWQELPQRLPPPRDPSAGIPPVFKGVEGHRVIVMGCGSIGRRHIGNLIALGATNIVGFDVRGDQRDRVRKAFGIDVAATIDEAFRHEPTIALVTASTSHHVPLAVAAAERGCHIFVEKPLSHERTDIDLLLKLVASKGLRTLVGCNMRFHPGLATLKQLLEENVLGTVVAARVQVGQYLPDWHPDEDYRQMYSARRELGGGIILDAIHEIDYLRWFFGEVAQVACFSGQLSHLEIDTEDTAGILLRFERGPVGEVHMDYVQRVYARTCQIIGDEGTALWDYTSDSVRHFSAKSKTWRDIRIASEWKPGDAYVDEMKHFLECIAEDRETTLPIADGYRVLEIALAALESSSSGSIISTC